MAVSHTGDSPLCPGKHYVDGVSLPRFVSAEHVRMLKTFSLDPTDVIEAGYPRSGIFSWN